jgi:hypothetical protein
MVYKKASILFITQNIKKYVYNVIHYALICFSGGYKSTGYANVLLIVKTKLGLTAACAYDFGMSKGSAAMTTSGSEIFLKFKF